MQNYHPEKNLPISSFSYFYSLPFIPHSFPCTQCLLSVFFSHAKALLISSLGWGSVGANILRSSKFLVDISFSMLEKTTRSLAVILHCSPSLRLDKSWWMLAYGLSCKQARDIRQRSITATSSLWMDGSYTSDGYGQTITTQDRCLFLTLHKRPEIILRHHQHLFV